MESMLPNGYVTSPAKLYGNYKNIREVTVRLFRDTEIQYYLLTGSEYGGDRKKVFSILCVKSVNGIIDESEYVYDVAASREHAESIFAPSHRAVSLRCSRICSAELQIKAYRSRFRRRSRHGDPFFFLHEKRPAMIRRSYVMCGAAVSDRGRHRSGREQFSFQV